MHFGDAPTPWGSLPAKQPVLEGSRREFVPGYTVSALCLFLETDAVHRRTQHSHERLGDSVSPPTRTSAPLQTYHQFEERLEETRANVYLNSAKNLLLRLHRLQRSSHLTG